MFNSLLYCAYLPGRVKSEDKNEAHGKEHSISYNFTTIILPALRCGQVQVPGYHFSLAVSHLSRWNLSVCTTSGIFCRMFHMFSVSSVQAVTRAPSFTRNAIWHTAPRQPAAHCRDTRHSHYELKWANERHNAVALYVILGRVVITTFSAMRWLTINFYVFRDADSKSDIENFDFKNWPHGPFEILKLQWRTKKSEFQNFKKKGSYT